MTRRSFELLLLLAFLALAQGHGPKHVRVQRKLGSSDSYKKIWVPGGAPKGSRKKMKCKGKRCPHGEYRKKKKYRYRNQNNTKYPNSGKDSEEDMPNEPHDHHHTHYNYDNKPNPPVPSPPAPTPQVLPPPVPTPPVPSPTAPTPQVLPPPVPTPQAPSSPVVQTRMPSIDTLLTPAPNSGPIPSVSPSTFVPLVSVLSEPPTLSENQSTVETLVPTDQPSGVLFTNGTLGGGIGNGTADAGLSPAGTTSVPTNPIVLRPPEQVITTTKAPTDSPTASALQSLETRSIKSPPLTFRASGTSNLGEFEIQFFEEVERILSPYAASEIGPMLTKFLLSIIFEHDKLDIVSLGLTGENTLYRSVFQVSAEFALEGVADEVSTFSSDDAAAVLGAVFKGQMLDRLLLGLSNKNIRISNIAEYDPRDEPAQGSSDSTPGPSDDDTPSDRSAPTSSKDRTNRNILLITLFAGAVVVLALSIAIYLNVRRRKRYYYYGEKVTQASRTSASGPGSTGGDSRGGGSRVQRAALATKSYDSRDFLRRDATMASGLEPMLNDIENHRHSYASPSFEEEKFEMEPLDPSPAPLPPSGPEPVTTATLTALDGSGSVGQLNEAYPEFDLFVGLKQPLSPQTQYDIPPSSPSSANKQDSPMSPYWSVDGAISAPEDEEYVNDRRRWQDEANDIGLVAPDHNSSRDDSSDAYNSSSTESQESEKGWSSTSDSDDDRKVQVLPSID